ncbi:MAG: chalcone isomerase family protein [Candidatus Parcubacteria bacterium]|nr:chalcone isomerase family protein [Burkholderiales bacterium]
MVFNRLFLGFFLGILACQAYSAEISGIKVEDKERLSNSELTLNGAGLRKRAFFQIYVIGLYLPEKKTVAADAIGVAGPKRVVFHMMRDVEADQFGAALTDGMKDNVPEAEMKALEPRLKQLLSTMLTMKEAKKGMRITLDWTPAGTVVTIDGKAAGQPIAGEDFYRALLKIWLGEKPVQADLKGALLGEKQ